jgi:hypothetical protein
MKKHDLIELTNTVWWNYINQHFEIIVQFKQVPCIQTNIHKTKVTIIVPVDNCIVEQFSFEVGKLYLLAKGLYTSEYLIVRFEKEPLLSWTLYENFFSWLGYQIDALLLIKLLRQAGVNVRPLSAIFLSPFNFTTANHQLSSGFKKEQLHSHTIALFIQQFFVREVGKYFYDNVSLLQLSLATTCPSLFEIMLHFTDAWNQSATEEALNDANRFKPLLKDFVHQIGLWCLLHFLSQPRKPFITHNA